MNSGILALLARKHAALIYSAICLGKCVLDEGGGQVCMPCFVLAHKYFQDDILVYSSVGLTDYHDETLVNFERLTVN